MGADRWSGGRSVCGAETRASTSTAWRRVECGGGRGRRCEAKHGGGAENFGELPRGFHEPLTLIGCEWTLEWGCVETSVGGRGGGGGTNMGKGRGCSATEGGRRSCNGTTKGGCRSSSWTTESGSRSSGRAPKRGRRRGGRTTEGRGGSSSRATLRTRRRSGRTTKGCHRQFELCTVGERKSAIRYRKRRTEGRERRT